MPGIVNVSSEKDERGGRGWLSEAFTACGARLQLAGYRCRCVPQTRHSRNMEEETTNAEPVYVERCFERSVTARATAPAVCVWLKLPLTRAAVNCRPDILNQRNGLGIKSDKLSESLHNIRTKIVQYLTIPS